MPREREINVQRERGKEVQGTRDRCPRSEGERDVQGERKRQMF